MESTGKTGSEAAIVENPDAPWVEPTRDGRAGFAAVVKGVLGFFVLLACLYLGEGMRRVLHVPLPSHVIGLAVLAASLVLMTRWNVERHTQCVEPAARLLISHMGLLFVPAGAGIIMEGAVLRTQWLPILAALLGSTLIGLASTGWLMQRHLSRRAKSDGTEMKSNV